MTREIAAIICSCGGQAEETDTTKQEEEIYGCGRKQCCVMAYKCNKCKTRWVFSLDAPEA